MSDRDGKAEATQGGTLLLVGLLILGSGGLDGTTGMVLGVAGAIIGGALGVATTLRLAGTPQEPAAQARGLAALLALVAAFAVAFALVPGWYRFLVFLPFGLGLALLIRFGRRWAGVPTRAEPGTGA